MYIYIITQIILLTIKSGVKIRRQIRRNAPRSHQAYLY
jgi:hypothetical protein